MATAPTHGAAEFTASYPKDNPRGQRGSTLGKAWEQFLTTMATRQNRPLTKDSRAYQRERRSLIRKADWPVARRLAKQARDAWHQRNLPALVGGSTGVMAKDAARAQLTRQLGRSIPGFRRAQALKRSHLQRHRKLTGTVLGASTEGSRLTWGVTDVPDAGLAGEQFLPPFKEFDMHTVDWDGLIVEDHSLVLPDSGHLVQNYVFEHNESAWGFYNPALFANHMASCGVAFTMPQEGRLQVTAQLENFFNRLDFSVSDNFGFSHSNLDVRIMIFVVFLRAADQFLFYPVELITTGVDSDGDDLARSVSDLDNSVAYAADITTKEILSAGESLKVLAGSHIRIDSDTDDMDAHVKATFWLRLRSLNIDVVA